MHSCLASTARATCFYVGCQGPVCYSSYLPGRFSDFAQGDSTVIHRIPSLAHGFKSTVAAKPRSLMWASHEKQSKTHQLGESRLLFGEHFVGILDEHNLS